MKKLLLITAIMTLGSFVPARAASIIGGALGLIPAGVGSYFTYKTLTYQPQSSRNRFAHACMKFDRAMSQSNPQSVSTALREGLLNFDFYFKSHEKMAMIGSAGALLVGAVLIPTSIVGALISYHKYYKATKAEYADLGIFCETYSAVREAKDTIEKEHWKSFMTRLKLLGVGTFSFLTGAASILLLADYARSTNVA